jgi:hypothetical protein
LFKSYDFPTKAAVLFMAMVREGNVNRFTSEQTDKMYVQYPDKLYHFNRDKRKWELGKSREIAKETEPEMGKDTTDVPN